MFCLIELQRSVVAGVPHTPVPTISTSISSLQDISLNPDRKVQQRYIRADLRTHGQQLDMELTPASLKKLCRDAKL